MTKVRILALVGVIAIIWWFASAPRPEIQTGPSITIDRSTGVAIAQSIARRKRGARP